MKANEARKANVSDTLSIARPHAMSVLGIHSETRVQLAGSGA
jgi:hypothetical protein